MQQSMESKLEKRSNGFEPWERLDGKVVMVTGASSGIGYELCLDLAKAGCRIVAAARRIGRLKSLCEEIERLDLDRDGPVVRAMAVELDVSANESVVEASVHKAWDAFGRIDALINNAGVRGSVKSPLDLPQEEWDNNFATNTRGSWLVSKHVCIHMCNTRQKGSIINISSITGLPRGQWPGAIAYVSSKSGLNAMTRAMALELGGHKIRVNSISPGIFKSEITEGLMKKEWLNKVVSKTVPLRTYGTSDPALTTLVRYLIHDSSEYVSGNVFVVDAGTSLPGVPIFASL
ncbi:hypothetical protein Sjap_012680 [Stephania japonica]|uniref:Secoisolariciresinol dehydrogenase n=1 Tax=Stephania japonica TaxID=461633 RepID=A0AAP0IY89_9MAGN